MYGLSEEDHRIQARARDFADELIPFEEEAERSDGALPADVTAAHAKRARELGLHSTNMPKALGGGGCTSLQQALVQEQMGRVTNALGWVAATPPSWLPEVATPDQIERYVRPAIGGDR
jgi:acyl-CoA dehydrogenase